MNDLKRGDIVFIRGRSPISPIIRYFDKGKFTHVGIMLDDGIHILDARLIGGVKPRHFDFTDYEVVRIPGVNIDAAKRYIGLGYDLLQFVWYGFRFGKVWNNPNKMICSELVAIALRRDDLRNMAPNELYEKLNEHEVRQVVT